LAPRYRGTFGGENGYQNILLYVDFARPQEIIQSALEGMIVWPPDHIFGTRYPFSTIFFLQRGEGRTGEEKVDTIRLRGFLPQGWGEDYPCLGRGLTGESGISHGL